MPWTFPNTSGKQVVSVIFSDLTIYHRYFLSDTWSHIVYGQPVGWVREGRDVDGLLDALQGVYAMSATAAVIPFLQPLLRNKFLRKHLWCYTDTFCNMERLFQVIMSPRLVVA